MTIKQHGGVFGRNPEYNNLDVKNDLNTKDLEVSGNSDFAGTVKISRTTPLIYLMETDTTDVNTRIRNAAGNFQISTANDALNSYSARINIDHSTGEVTVYDNLVINTSGKGIDFSATAGTGTSELFDDYEEGTWTAEIYDASSGGNQGTVLSSCHYTKIGNVVHVDGVIYNFDTTGMTAGNVLYIKGLPFSQGSGNQPGTVTVRDFTFSGYVTPMLNGTWFTLYDATSGGAAYSELTVSSVGSNAGVYFGATYRV